MVRREEMAAAPRPLEVADPAALGLGAFALTTFILSATNAFGVTRAPLLAYLGFGLFYGGLGQFMAGMWEFRNRNIFGATAFSTYGAFWMGLSVFVLLIVFGKVPTADVAPSLGWILLAFAIFNSYMLIMSTRVNLAVFLVFLTLEVTEILLAWGNFNGDAPGKGLVQIGGYVGIITAIVAWYTSMATVAKGQGHAWLPEGTALWPIASAESSAAMPGETVGRPTVT